MNFSLEDIKTMKQIGYGVILLGVAIAASTDVIASKSLKSIISAERLEAVANLDYKNIFKTRSDSL